MPDTNHLSASAAEFERLVLIETDEHVLWTRNVPALGYGIFTINSKNFYVHRSALIRHSGFDPGSTAMALHRPGIGCVKHCMNYRHLYWGDRRQNSLDAIQDGVAAIGERHPHALLTEENVREIRRLRSTGLTYKQIASRFPVTWYAVKEICKRHRWAHVD